MREQPKRQIAKDAIKAWRIMATIYMTIYFLITFAFGVVSLKFQLPILFSIIALIIGIIGVYAFIFLIPKLRYRRWRYEIFEQEIYIQHGILIVTRTIIPMIRVQH